MDHHLLLRRFPLRGDERSVRVHAAPACSSHTTIPPLRALAGLPQGERRKASQNPQPPFQVPLPAGSYTLAAAWLLEKVLNHWHVKIQSERGKI